MKKLEFELELEKLSEQIFFKEELLEYINVHRSYEQQFAKRLKSSLNCNVIMGGPSSGIFGEFHIQTKKQVNWIEIYAGTKAALEVTNIYGQKRYITVSTSKLGSMVAMSDESCYSILLNEVVRPGFIAGVEIDFLRYKKNGSITISKSRARSSQKLGGIVLDGVRMIHNLGSENARPYEFRTDLKYNCINLAIEYRYYNLILNIEGGGQKHSTVRKLYLSRGANLRDYFDKEGSLDIYHLDVEKSPLYNPDVTLDKLDGIYLSWRPHIVDMYLLEEAREHPQFPHYDDEEDTKGDDEKEVA